MKGNVLGFDEEAGNGHIRSSEDNRRYAFDAGDVRGGRKLKAGDQVDFEAKEDRAVDVYFVAGAGIQIDVLKDAAADAGKALSGMIANRPSGAEVADQIGGNPIGRFLLGRAGVFYALLILIACFLPFTPSSLGAPASERMSLMGMSTLIGNVKDAAAQLELTLRALTPPPMPGAPTPAPQFTGFGFLFYSALDLQYLLYLIPLYAAYVVFLELKGTATRRNRVLSGLLALALPTALLAASASLIWAAIPDEIKTLVRNLGSNVQFTDLFASVSPTVGYVALIVTGLLSILAAFGAVKAPLDYLRR